MKNFYLLFSALGLMLFFTPSIVKAQDGAIQNVGTTAYYDAFDYTVGKLQDGGGTLIWGRESLSTITKTKVRELTGDDVMVTTGSLSYPGLTSTGNKIAFTGTSASYYMRFNGLVSTTPHLYVSFILRVTTLPDVSDAGNHFFSLGNNTNNCGMIYIRRSTVNPAKFNLGIRKSNVTPESSPVWSNQDLDINSSYYLVLGVDQGSGTPTRGDVVNLYINSTVPAVTVSEGGDFSNFNGIAWALFHREKENATNFTIEADEFRLGLTWSQVATLPVSFDKFYAETQTNRIKLAWSTFSEQSNSHFEIERSFNGIDFLPLTTLPGKGNASERSIYSVFDDNPQSGINYYRLTQVDINGRKTILSVTSATFELKGDSMIAVYPNPVGSEINLLLKNYEGSFKTVLSALDGRVIHEQESEAKAGQSVYLLSLASKPVSGIYVLRVTGEKGLMQSVKIIVP